MSRPGRIDYRPLLWILLILLFLAGIPWFVFKPSTESTKRVRFSTDTNGFPSLLGVSLTNTNARDTVFRIMGAVGIKASLRMPSSIGTIPGQYSHFDETLESMGRAGLLNKN